MITNINTTVQITTTTQLPELPVEIQHSILNHLTFRECIQCTSVSRSWRFMVLNRQKMWECISTRDKHTIVPQLLAYKDHINGSFVKRIYINRFSNPKHWPMVVDFLTAQQCNAIKEGPAADSMDWQLTLPGGFVHLHLADLAIDITNSNDILINSASFFQALPKLEHLALSLENIADTGALLLPSSLQQYCPNLLSLVLSGSGDYNITARHKLQQKTKTTVINHGLCEGITSIILRNSWNTQLAPMASSLLYEFIQQSQTNLRLLDLTGADELFSHDMITYLIGHSFPMLTHLTLRWQPMTDSPNATLLHRFIIQAATQLKYLGLKCKHHFADDELLSALSDTAQLLQELELDYSELITSNGLQRFLKTMAHPNRTLRKIVFNGTPALNREILHIIATSESCIITEMAILHCRNVSIDDVEQFFNDMLVHKNSGDNNTECSIIMKNLELCFYHDKDPADFVNNNKKGREFLKKLDSVAKEWKFTLCSPVTTLIFGNYREEIITHDQFRKINRKKLL
ncbi:hypothetical protein INT45_011433 [Circinella minor]|uniref:F-box domain-containing protein n=1 Tax=Circinella minor TaxID=1195481 RepID=A0A8H7SBU0_9FUNG|nr:hypothetical protein INT45_011433 [Circinella minor]